MVLVAFLLYQTAMAELAVGDNLTVTTSTPIYFTEGQIASSSYTNEG